MQEFDAVVIGSGIGGGTSARALSEAGYRVLILEAGFEPPRDDTSFMTLEEDPEARLRGGCWPDPVHAEVDGRSYPVYAPLGSGIGGTSVFYAATTERPALHDLEELPGLLHPTGGWPVTWAEMAPWFDLAERQLHVCGEPDPLDPRPQPELRPAPPLSASDQLLVRDLQRNGLHPYRLHTATARPEACQACFGRRCPVACKMDGRSAGVEPALATGRTTVLTGARVLRIHSNGPAAEAVEYQHEGRRRRVTARQVILAAGAYASPGLIRASASDFWPEGPGNRFDQAGRKLMFHFSEKFVVWPGRAAAAEVSKTLALRDFYADGGQRLGMVQSMGVKASLPEILHFMRQRAAERGYTSRVLRQALRIPALVASKVLGHAVLFDGQMEDFPDPENRLLFDPEDPGRIAFTYRVPEEAEVRRRLFRSHIRRAFRGRRMMFLSARADLNLGHPCGTLAMGRAPETSVTDAFGRVHGMENLWVADASVFPTSMAVNPSLTITALALRQAERIGAELGAASREAPRPAA